jgi:hypothetical protein
MSSYLKSNSPGICINEVLYILYGFPHYRVIVKSSFVIDPKQSACCVPRLTVKINGRQSQGSAIANMVPGSLCTVPVATNPRSMMGQAWVDVAPDRELMKYILLFDIYFNCAYA